jgi:uncharacterized cupredoxin-like copper-binding protein
MRSRHDTVTVMAVAGVLAAASVLGLATAGGAFDSGQQSRTGAACAVPALPGTVIGAALINMGGPMRGGAGSMRGGAMRLSLDRNTTAAGDVSFLASNVGSVTHELLILPLPAGQIVGTRPINADAKIDEAGSLGEASNSCAAGTGDGIASGASGWVTVTLPPGHYEVVCNLPGHYGAGMYAQLIVN